jgi:hypothetical protein
MEDVRPIPMNVDSRDFLGITIAADVVALVNEQHSLAAISHRAGKHAAEHSAANDNIVERHDSAEI